MAFAAARSETLAEINITPLVDVMLVLLVIFMIAAPALTRSLSLQLPQASPPTPDKPTTVLLDVQAGDVFALDGVVLSPRDLGLALAQWQHGHVTSVLKLHTAPDADYQSFVTALATARRAGVDNIAVDSR